MSCRFYILQGDKTSNGGIVKTGLGSQLWHGKPQAFEGDSVYCPVCKSVGTISCVGTRIPFTGSHGRQAALDGDLCVCKCSPPPRLVAGQSTFRTLGDSFGTTGQLPTPCIQPEDWAEIIEQYFEFSDGMGNPIDEYRYDLFENDRLSVQASDLDSGKARPLESRSQLWLVAWLNKSGQARS